MGGKALGGKRVTNDEAYSIFEGLIVEHELGEKSQDIMLCGSARRKEIMCGDIDIVYIDDENNNFKAWLVSMFGYQKNGKPKNKGLVNGVQVEFYESTKEAWGSQTLMWTGSAYHNIKMRRVAKKLGYSMSQYGVKDSTGKYLTLGMTAAEIFGLLGMKYLPPKSR